MKKIYLIDGSSFLYRFYYAIKNLSYNGLPTNVIFGFARLLIGMQNQEYLAICFDSKEKTFRKELFDDYKKQRPPMPEGLAVQIEPTKELIKAFGINIFKIPGFEADDIIATIAKKLKNEHKVVIVTQDKDLFQLVESNVAIYDPVKNIAYDKQKTFERFGLTAQQIGDYLALAGDSSDGIPGITSIGEKTAKKLLAEYHNIENILKNKEKLPPKIQANLDTEKLYFYRSLTQLNTNVPLDITLEDLAKINPDTNKLSNIFETYNFKSLIDKIGASLKPSVIQKAANIFELNQETFATQKTEENSKNALEDKDLLELASYLIQPDFEGNIDKAIAFVDKKLSVECQKLTEKEKIAFLKPIFLDLIKKLDLDYLLFDVELPLKKLLLKMQQKGIKVDINKLSSFRIQALSLIEQTKKAIAEIIGEEVNINSPLQLQKALFEKLQLKPTKKIKTGFSTDSVTLEHIDHKIAKLILEYRAITKLLSTYIEPLINLADKNARIHTTFNQTTTATGRLSSSNPNMQNLPVDNPYFNIREAVICDEGYTLICADYSQIELRVLAQLSKDPLLIDIFKKDLDVHTQTAIEVFNILPTMVDAQMRRIAKTINFGIMYGMGASSLSKTLGIPKQQAQNYIGSYFKRFNKAKEFIDETIKEVKNLGYTQTFFNRRRYFNNINSNNRVVAEFENRAAVNAKIQGTAADIIKIAMVKLDKALQGLDAHIVLQIHDELIIECGDTIVKKVREITKITMQTCVNFDVSLKVNIGTGKTWYAAKS